MFEPEENNKEDLLMTNLEKNKAKAFNEKSTNLSENDDGNNVSSKSNQGNQLSNFFKKNFNSYYFYF